MKFKTIPKETYNKIKFEINDDESITSNPKGDSTLYLNDISFALTFDSKTKKIISFEGYKFGFKEIENLIIPDTIHGEIFAVVDICDGDYISKNFYAQGVYSKTTNWYAVGDIGSKCESISIAENFIISLNNSELCAIYFKV